MTVTQIVIAVLVIVGHLLGIILTIIKICKELSTKSGTG